jgi:hypothetical protein
MGGIDLKAEIVEPQETRSRGNEYTCNEVFRVGEHTRQEGDLISLLLFFQNKENRLITVLHNYCIYFFLRIV